MSSFAALDLRIFFLTTPCCYQDQTLKFVSIGQRQLVLKSQLLESATGKSNLGLYCYEMQTGAFFPRNTNEADVKIFKHRILAH